MSRAWFPFTRYVPRGMNPWYDMQRFAGCKAFDCIFDIGANIGQTARQLLLYFPQAQIYSFEPASDTFQQLTGLSRLHPNLHCVNCALGSRAGDGQMAVYADSELNTFRPDAARWGPPARTDVVTIDTLDRFCEARSIGSIDILKMDVQGSELDVLQGASTLFAQQAVRYVYAEVAFRRQEKDMQYFADLNAFLEQHGFWFCGLYEAFRWGDRKQYVGFANALYVNPDYRGPSTEPSRR